MGDSSWQEPAELLYNTLLIVVHLCSKVIIMCTYLVAQWLVFRWEHLFVVENTMDLVAVSTLHVFFTASTSGLVFKLLFPKLTARLLRAAERRGVKYDKR